MPKGETRLDGFDDKIISLYARGMTVREIQGHLQELYGVEVSPDLISRVTDAVLEEVREWQNRPLDPVYPVVFFDALRVKIRDEGLVRNKAVYVALALDADGQKHVLGLWIEQSEGAKFWLKVMNELKTRGVERHPDRRGRRPEGLPGGDQRRLPGGHRADLHRPSDPQLAGLRLAGRTARRSCRRLRAIYRAETAEVRRSDRLGDVRGRMGQRAIRRSARPGGATGTRSSRSSPSRRRSGR